MPEIYTTAVRFWKQESYSPRFAIDWVCRVLVEEVTFLTPQRTSRVNVFSESEEPAVVSAATHGGYLAAPSG
jgi:hypothetical protein